MKRVKELAKENSKLTWKHFTANKQAKTKVSVKETTTANENREIFQQSIDKPVHQVSEKEIIKQSTTSTESHL